MSTTTRADHFHPHPEAEDAHAEGASHGSFGSYMIGFGLSVLLTAVPFWLVMGNVLGDPSLTGIVIMVLAAVQIVVHMVYFLHMNTRSEGGWSMLAMIFTIIVVVIALSGSLWVMYHLNANMMPAHNMDLVR
jgi:cytochrome o ubiquinol oxidase operon protein cyoD